MSMNGAAWCTAILLIRLTYESLALALEFKAKINSHGSHVH